LGKNIFTYKCMSILRNTRPTAGLCSLLLQPKEPREGDESDNFARVNKFSKNSGGDEEATTDSGEGDRRHLMQAAQPKDPKEVRVPVGWLVLTATTATIAG
jgi:hypothetical protein